MTTKRTEAVRGFPIVEGAFTLAGEAELASDLLSELRRASPLAFHMYLLAATRSGPHGFRRKYQEWADLLHCSRKSAIRCADFLEAARLLDVVRSDGGAHDARNWFRVPDKLPEHLPAGLTIRGGQRAFAAFRAAALKGAKAAPEAIAAPESPAPPVARFASEMTVGAAEAAPPVEAVDELLAKAQDMAVSHPVEAAGVASVVEFARTSNRGDAWGAVWDQLEDWSVAARPAAPDPWMLAAAKSEAAGSVDRAAEDLVYGFHEIGLGRVGHLPIDKELALARLLLSGCANIGQAWEILRTAVHAYHGRMRKLGKPTDHASFFGFILRDLDKAGASWVIPARE